MTTRRDFLDYVRTMIRYWGQTAKTPQDAAAGMAHSLLVALDGEAADVPAFALRPLNEDGTEGPDIIGAAMLHEEMFRTEDAATNYLTHSGDPRRGA